MDDTRMLDAASVLAEMTDRGVQIWIDGDQLRYRVTRGAVHRDDLAKLTGLKQEIRELISRSPLVVAGRIPPPGKRVPSNRAPLTFAQEHAWLSQKFDKRPSVLIGGSIRVLGPLRVECLRRSLTELVRRHESLRTRVIDDDGVPMQEIDEAGPFELEMVSVANGGREDRETMAKQWLQPNLMRRVDVSVHHTFAAVLLKLDDQDHVLVLYRHIELSDMSSFKIIWRELWALYTQNVRGLPFSLPEVPIQLADYATWERQTNHLWLDEHQTYWETRFEGARHLELFPVEEAASMSDRPWKLVAVNFDKNLLSALRASSRQRRTTAMMSVLTAYAVLVARWCNSTDVTIWVPVYGRFYPEIEHTVGSFAWPLPLRIRIFEQDTLLDVMGRVIKEYASAIEHHDFFRAGMPREALTGGTGLNWMSCEHQADPVAYFNENGDFDRDIRLDTFAMEPDLNDFFYDQEAFEPQYFFANEMESEVRGFIAYRADRGTSDTMNRFGNCIVRFVRTLVASPQIRVAELSCHRVD